MKIGFIDWREKDLFLYIFEKKGSSLTLADTLSVSAKEGLTQAVLNRIAGVPVEHIYLSIPLNLLSVREITVPFTDKNKIKDVIPYELEGLLLSDINDYCIGHVVMESSNGSSKVLAASAEKARLKEIIEALSRVAPEPRVITSVDIISLTGGVEDVLQRTGLDEKARIEAIKKELLNPSINLRQSELSYTGDIKRLMQSVKITAALAMILLIVLSADMVVRFLAARKENLLLVRGINTIYSETFPEDKKIVDAVRQFKGNLNSLKKKEVLLTGISSLDLLLSIANLKKDAVLYEFNADGKNIILKGTAQSFEGVDSLGSSLSSSFMDVRITDSKTSFDRKINFTIVMRER
ncbi:MAG: hypothetical protein HY756_03460 [Nitrospirae bacterium]|nr:hypothetical protein [Nitrospirota bacterium]